MKSDNPQYVLEPMAQWHSQRGYVGVTNEAELWTLYKRLPSITTEMKSLESTVISLFIRKIQWQMKYALVKDSYL